MRRLLLLIPFVLLGCSSQTPEEAEAAKYDKPKMLSDEEAKKITDADRASRNGSAPPPTTTPPGSN